MPETELERVTRERDEFWSRLVELGRELFDNDPENENSPIALMTRDRDELLEEIEKHRKLEARHEDDLRRSKEYADYLRNQLGNLSSEVRDLRRQRDALARELAELNKKESARDYRKKSQAPAGYKPPLPSWAVFNEAEVRARWAAKKR